VTWRYLSGLTGREVLAKTGENKIFDFFFSPVLAVDLPAFRWSWRA